MITYFDSLTSNAGSLPASFLLPSYRKHFIVDDFILCVCMFSVCTTCRQVRVYF